ncbi:MAG TPA: hypothetical protein VJM32_01940 [Candidatus Saccharimonadales bacterium]|nr:hypothetical protein [Candidatus Saccharimonadales bacterium]
MKMQPVYRQDDSELLGHIRHNNDQWEALTVFGVAFATFDTEKDATQAVMTRGLSSLMGQWEFLEDDTTDWEPCVITEASPKYVRIAKMHGPYPDTSKTYLIQDDIPTRLRPAA